MSDLCNQSHAVNDGGSQRGSALMSELDRPDPGQLSAYKVCLATLCHPASLNLHSPYSPAQPPGSPPRRVVDTPILGANSLRAHLRKASSSS